MKRAFSWLRAVGDYLSGFFLYGLIKGVHEEKRGLDMLIMTSVFGTTIGFPHLFNYYHLRLIPFYMRTLDPWKRNVLRERDVFDRIND
ncbi:MAG: hypothetical protein JRL30_14270 [Deltaproteobacteria bacterium]|nr:hypothetical protein [Deltaproteobacteria bacterium]